MRQSINIWRLKLAEVSEGARFGRIAFACAPMREAEPIDEQGKECCTEAEFDGKWSCRGREKGFKKAGDEQEWYGSGQQTQRFSASQRQSACTTKNSREEKAPSEAKTGSTGQKDAGQFERAVRSNEAPETERHALLRTGSRDNAHHQSVVEEQEQRAEAARKATGKGDKANANVVGGDGGRGLWRDGDERFGPHLVMLNRRDHLRAEEGAHEFGANESENGAENTSSQKDKEGRGGERKQTTKENRIVAEKEESEAAQRDAVAGIDELMGSGDELIE